MLFVGDELTQQMFFTIAFAAAVTAVKPDANLRFFNSGNEGSTAGHALDWIGALIDLAPPTVVFVCFGLNESEAETSDPVQHYKQPMSGLAGRLRAFEQVRSIVLLTPPPINPSGSTSTQPTVHNEALHQLAKATYGLATVEQVGFVNLFDHLRAVYLEAKRVGSPPLTLGGRATW